MNKDVHMTLSSRSIDVTVLAHQAESLGFASLWLPAHPLLPVHVTGRAPRTLDLTVFGPARDRDTWSRGR
jgi:hypothetical protein